MFKNVPPDCRNLFTESGGVHSHLIWRFTVEKPPLYRGDVTKGSTSGTLADSSLGRSVGSERRSSLAPGASARPRELMFVELDPTPRGSLPLRRPTGSAREPRFVGLHPIPGGSLPLRRPAGIPREPRFVSVHPTARVSSLCDDLLASRASRNPSVSVRSRRRPPSATTCWLRSRAEIPRSRSDCEGLAPSATTPGPCRAAEMLCCPKSFRSAGERLPPRASVTGAPSKSDGEPRRGRLGRPVD